MIQKEEINKKIWQKLSRDFTKLEPPYRPSKKRMDIYKKLALSTMKNSGNKVLVLGTTPEIRDLLFKLKCDVTILDISPNMIKTTTDSMKFKNKIQEKIIIGNWLNANGLLNEKFDIIIGDSVTNNITSGQLAIFFRKLSKMIKSTGSILLTNAGCYVQRKITIEEIIGRIKKDWKYYKNKKNLMHDTWCFWCSNAGIKDIYCDAQEKIFEKRFKKGELTKKELNLLKVGIDHLKLSMLGREIERLMKKYFKINRIFRESKSHKVFDFYRIYELKLKNK